MSKKKLLHVVLCNTSAEIHTWKSTCVLHKTDRIYRVPSLNERHYCRYIKVFATRRIAHAEPFVGGSCGRRSSPISGVHFPLSLTLNSSINTWHLVSPLLSSISYVEYVSCITYLKRQEKKKFTF